MECEFCKKIFSNKSALNKHKKQAKYCLDIQNVKPDTIHKCNICEKTFNVKSSLERHKNLCKINPSKLIDEIEELKKALQEQKLENLQKIVDDKNDQLKVYQEQNEKLLMKAVSAPKVKNTYNTVNIENFTAMTDEHIENSAKFLTIDHINDGPHGYAVFIVTITCKNSIVVTDGSRMIFKYKDKNNKLFVDVEARNLLTKISKAIDPINSELLLKATKALNENKNMDLMYKISRKALLLEYCNGIKFMDGEPSDFSRTLIHEMMVLTQKRVNGMIEDKPEEKKEEKCVENAIEIDLISDAESEVIYYSDS